jgi:SAM-dependent methyltransferase
LTDPTRRFSGRVENYARYRPGYPGEVLDLLRQRCGLAEDSEIADVGSGTGALARLFLENGNRVFGVEPNAEMRGAGERLLR